MKIFFILSFVSLLNATPSPITNPIDNAVTNMWCNSNIQHNIEEIKNTDKYFADNNICNLNAIPHSEIRVFQNYPHLFQNIDGIEDLRNKIRTIFASQTNSAFPQLFMCSEIPSLTDHKGYQQVMDIINEINSKRKNQFKSEILLRHELKPDCSFFFKRVECDYDFPYKCFDEYKTYNEQGVN